MNIDVFELVQDNESIECDLDEEENKQWAKKKR